MKSTLSILFYLILSLSISAQESFIFKKGLAVKSDPPGRRSLSQADPIEYMIVKGTWKEPEEGDNLDLDTSSTKWFQVSSDEKGWFQDQKLRGSYIYSKYISDEEKIMILEGHSYYNVFVNQQPRIGNVYGNKDFYESWEPNFNFSYLPVKINKGENEFLFQVSYGRMKALLHEINSPVFFNTYDNTLPDLFSAQPYDEYGGIVIVNAQPKTLKNAKIKVTNSAGDEILTEVPSIIPLSVRKVRFNFKGIAPSSGNVKLKLQLIVNNEITDEKVIEIKCVNRYDTYKQTFTSNIDGSIQYYAVKPSLTEGENQALFLSAHGARVEAFNQAASYHNKEWGNIVCPTNRRPYGFNWEDIGRIDALEVLNIAKNKFKPDENRIYLTGHSMGGHGTWYLGANYPDQFAAIGPSAGWISLWSYRFDNLKDKFTDVQKLFTKAAKQSDTYTLATNYAPLGIYIIHGSADSVVSPSQARSMMRKLETFHKDYDYHFEPDKEHWWDIDTVKPGTDCVDWTPLFDFFSRHARPQNRIKNLNFTTAAPGISSKNYWVEVIQQLTQFDFSNIEIEFVPKVNLFRTNVSNIKTFAIDTDYLGLAEGSNFSLLVNDQKVEGKTFGPKIYLTVENEKWDIINNINKNEKHPGRYGSFKDLFRDSLTIVYGTQGSEEEKDLLLAKVRYDSEMFWYVGNGALEIISDRDFDHSKYKNCNILLYGTEDQNSAFDKLLKDSPISVSNKRFSINENSLAGDDLACYLVYPKKGTDNNLVGVIAGTGIEGMKLTYMRPFLKPGASFPDVTVFNSDILESDNSGIKAVGLYGLDWSVENGEFIIK